ncbi:MULTISPECIES: hypothetical protein [Ruegeria]|jgi:hypothetical protein|uniref:hypothetical protein n=1 Tax=Ruegeria TaxID=97050 RepID=UPI00147FDFD7|nr:hypothetical protein [Ruegeria lacuscaerulensis]
MNLFSSRRRVLAMLLSAVAVVPVARIGLMKLKDNPLPQVPEPRLTLVDGWLLDESDPGAGEAS